MLSRNMSRFLFLVAVTFVAGLLAGCYSFTASTLPSHIKTVQIHEVEDKTLDPVLANNIHTAVVDMFKKNAGGVRLVNENANADFEMTLLSYTNKPENYNSNSDHLREQVAFGRRYVRYPEERVRRSPRPGPRHREDAGPDCV